MASPAWCPSFYPPRGDPRAQIPAAPFTGVSGLARWCLRERRGGEERRGDSGGGLWFCPLGRQRGRREGSGIANLGVAIDIKEWATTSIKNKRPSLPLTCLDHGKCGVRKHARVLHNKHTTSLVIFEKMKKGAKSLSNQTSKTLK
jgi:hypothetical protein